MHSVDSYFDQQIKSLEKKRRLFKVGEKAAKEAGYDLESSARISGLSEAYDAASISHARAMGDGPYKPVDYDFHYPESDAAYGRFVVEECKDQRIKKLPPKLDMKAELKVLQPGYKGGCSLKDAFSVAATVAANADEEQLDKLKAFSELLVSQKNMKTRQLGGQIQALVSTKRELA